MKLTFTYNRSHDLWRILNYGKTSINSPAPTKVYKELTSTYGDSPSEDTTNIFIESYFSKYKTDIISITKMHQNSWQKISAEYQKRTETIFGITLPSDVTAYLTINNRCPYNIESNIFYVSMYGSAPTKTTMHELWHFYTWYKYGIEWKSKLGAQRYNELKEALTVLLNVECVDLLPDGIQDNGYPQHKKLREKILELWSQNRNMDNLWKVLVS